MYTKGFNFEFYSFMQIRRGTIAVNFKSTTFYEDDTCEYNSAIFCMMIIYDLLTIISDFTTIASPLSVLRNIIEQK